MLERRLEQRRGHALPPLIRRDDKADDGADAGILLALDVDQLRLRCRVAPADDAPESIRDEAVRLCGQDQLRPERAVLFLGPRVEVFDEAFGAIALRPV